MNSAKAYLKIMEEGPGFSKLLWGFVGGKPTDHAVKTMTNIPTSTPESIAMSKELLKRGFKFVGPTIVYAFMQATGMVNDHLVTCHCYGSAGRGKAGKTKLLKQAGKVAKKKPAKKLPAKKISAKKAPAKKK